jgi:hypothetical protein
VCDEVNRRKILAPECPIQELRLFSLKRTNYELVFPRFNKLYWQENRDGADGAIPDQLFSGAWRY